MSDPSPAAFADSALGGALADVGRGLLAYCFLLLLFRLAGRRTLAELTTFDLVVAFLISSAARPLLQRRDAGVSSGLILTTTLVAVHWALSWVKTRSRRLARLLEGRPTLLWSNGRPHRAAMRREQVDVDDLLHAARLRHGLTDLAQVERAYLEVDGAISVVPREPARQDRSARTTARAAR